MTRRNGHTGARHTSWGAVQGRGATFFHGKVTLHTGKPQTWLSGRGSRQGAAVYRSRQVPPTPKTSEESRNAQMKSAEDLRPEGTGGPGRLRTTARRGSNTRQASGSGCALSIPDGRHGFTFQPHAQRPRPMLRVRPHSSGSSRYHSLRSGSGTQRPRRVLTHPLRRPPPAGPSR